jgi:2-C-methyl-D-erythritol 4-phosphate cytidylyltransferase
MPKFEKIAHGTADAIRKVTGREKYKITDAVILAAGSSTRMGGADKQFLELDGMPVIARTIKAFEDAPCIRETVIVTKPESVEKLRALCEKYGFKKIRAIVKGGETRQESAWLGFAELPDETEFVAIHDGARCLVTPHMIEDVARQAYLFGGATAACPVSDTVKRTEKRKFITETLDRDQIWLAQTPQIFSANLYRAAAYTAREAGFVGTDDCSLAERIKYNTVQLVDCGRENMKITTPEDVFFAEAFLALRRKREENENAR